ncbi:MAG: hypothetical protein HC822_22410 [Oscillochloris sp.]|nr:hypothetical protein [Oscillochloris sp.]
MSSHLRMLLNDLGNDGGLLSPSIYDTAQTMRLGRRTLEQQTTSMDWLLSRQEADGGWGATHQPAARELPTVAALLALAPAAATDRRIAAACRAGHDWFAQQPDRWSGICPTIFR